MINIIVSIILITSVCHAGDKYSEAQNKLAEGVYIYTGIQDNLNNYGKYLESQVDKKYRPFLGFTFSTLDIIIKQRIEINMRFK